MAGVEKVSRPLALHRRRHLFCGSCRNTLQMFKHRIKCEQTFLVFVTVCFHRISVCCYYSIFMINGIMLNM